ncbi:MAG: TrkA family potassium uptake protein [Nitrospirae bacterium]|nr:TrkA family potassium uptake protein [Nitrospirota bacterium]
MKQFAVLGLGRFGLKVARTLAEKGCDILAIDTEKDKIDAVRDFVSHAIQITSNTEEVYKAIGVDKVDVAIVGIGAANVEASILVTALLRKVGVREIIARAVSELHGEILRLVGATKVVYPEDEMGYRVAAGLVMPRLIDHIELKEGYGLAQVKCPAEFINKMLKGLNLRTKFNVNLLAVKKSDGTVDIPEPDYRFGEGDLLIMIGRDEDLEKLAEEE